MTRDPEKGPWFARPVLLIAIIFFGLIVADYIDRVFEASPPITARHDAAR